MADDRIIAKSQTAWSDQNMVARTSCPSKYFIPFILLKFVFQKTIFMTHKKTKGKLSQSVKSMPCRSARLGSARLGSGPVRSGPVRSGPVRSGPVRVGRKLPMYYPAVVSLYAFDMIISKKSCFSATFVLQICVKLWLYLPIHHYVCANRIALADTRVSHYAARL